MFSIFNLALKTLRTSSPSPMHSVIEDADEIETPRSFTDSIYEDDDWDDDDDNDDDDDDD